MHLFYLQHPDSDEAKWKEYYSDVSQLEFKEMMEQLAEVYKVNMLAREGKTKRSKIVDTETKSEDFYRWITEQERLSDQYTEWKEEFIKTNNLNDSDDEIPSVTTWSQQEIVARHLLQGRATHERIWNILRFLEQKQFISVELLREFHEFREIAYDIFKLLDTDNGNLLFKFKINYDNYWEVGQINEHFWQTITMHCQDTLKQDFKDFIEKYKKTNHYMSYHKLQYMLWFAKVNHQFDIHEMQATLYTSLGGKGACCQDLRAHSIKKDLRNVKPGLQLPIIKNFVTEILHIFDIYTDMSLASTMYYLSRDKEHQDGDYNICFVWICLCTFGPYIIQYSTMMNLLYHKGVYTRSKMQQANCCKKIFMTINFTVLGLMIMPLIDLLIKIEALVYLLLLPCSFSKGKQKNLFEKTQQKFKHFFETTFNLNQYEMENYKQQNKYTQMIFEDFLMLVLDVLIFGHILNVPRVRKMVKQGSALTMQIATTIVSVYKAMSALHFESKNLQEYFIIYLLTAMKAKLSWVPFGNRLEANQLIQNMDFDQIKLKKGGIMGSDSMNSFMKIDFKFSDLTLKLLTKQIQHAKMKKSEENFPKNLDENVLYSEDDIQAKRAIFNKQPDVKFGESMSTVTAHQFLNFIDINRMIDRNQVDKYFKLAYIDWQQLVENSKQDVKPPKDDEKPVKLITDFGKPLLQVCIDSDWVSEWPLKELMSIILKEYNCDPNVTDYFGNWTLLQCAIFTSYQRLSSKRTWLSFDMLLEQCKDTLDPNIYNAKDQTTPYGCLLERSYWDGVKKMINTLKIKVDFHKKQVPSKEEDGTVRVVTPIQYFMNRFDSQDFMESLDEMMESKKWIKFFGTDPWYIEEKDEITQLLELSHKKANLKELITDLFNKRIQKKDLQTFYNEQKDDAEKIIIINNISSLINLTVGKIHEKSKLLQTKAITLTQSTMSEMPPAEKKYVNKCFLEILLTTFIELSSFFDFVSDMVILIALGKSTDTAWFSFAIFTMICPYYTIYTSLTNFQIQKASKKFQTNTFGWSSAIGSTITVLPTMLIALILVDFGFMIVSVIVYPILLVFSPFPIGERIFDYYDEKQNNFLSKLFGMSFMEIKGFRCQRTILQFQLESVPQIFFQIYLIIRLKQLNRSQEEFGVSIDAIVFSVYCAVFHVLFEIANLYIEARTSESSVLQYVIACYNSRENWVPRQEILQENDNEVEESTEPSLNKQSAPGKSNKKKRDLIELDKATLLCNGRISFNIGFRFTEQNLNSLFQLISNMPIQQQGQLKRLAIDYCFEEIKPARILDLGRIAYQKVKLEFEHEKLMKKIENDQKLIELLRYPEELDINDIDFIVIMLARVKQKDLLHMLIQLKAEFNVESKLARSSFISILKTENLFSIILSLYDQREYLEFKPDFILKFRTNFCSSRIHKLYDDINKKNQPDILRCIATLALDPSQFTPIHIQYDEMQDNIQNQDTNRKFETLVNMASYYPIPMMRLYKNWWARDSRGDPKFYVRFKKSLLKFKAWLIQYPKTIKVYSSETDFEYFDTVFLSKFTKFRQHLINTYADTLSQDDYHQPVSMSMLSDGKKCSIRNLRNVLKILNGQYHMMTLLKLAMCDEIVETLGLDKDRAIYFHNSRNYLPVDVRKQVIEVVEVNTKNFRYMIPSHVLGVKQLTISKVNKNDIPMRIWYTIDFGVSKVRQQFFIQDQRLDDESEELINKTDKLEKLFKQLDKQGKTLETEIKKKKQRLFANEQSIYSNRFYMTNDLIMPRIRNHILTANAGLDFVTQEALDELKAKPFPSKFEQDICTMCYYFCPWSNSDGRWQTVKEKFLKLPNLLDKLRHLDYDKTTKEQYQRGKKLFRAMSYTYFRDLSHGLKQATNKSKIGGLYIWGWHIDDLPGCIDDAARRKKVIQKSITKNKQIIAELDEYFRKEAASLNNDRQTKKALIENNEGNKGESSQDDHKPQTEAEQESNQKLPRHSSTKQLYEDYFNEIAKDTNKMAAAGKQSMVIAKFTPRQEWPWLKDEKHNYWKFRFGEMLRQNLRAGDIISDLYAQNYFIENGLKNWDVVPKFECVFKLEMYKRVQLDGTIEQVDDCQTLLN